MKRWKPALLLVLAVLLAAGAACSSADRQELPPEPEEGVLTYAALNPISDDLERTIDLFNEEHTDVQIEVQDYSDEGGIERLLVELVAGRVPDIMELHKIAYATSYYGDTFERLWFGNKLNTDNSHYKDWKSYSGVDYWLPYRRLAQKGYFEDLWPYIENDPELGRESVLEAPLKAAEVDGGLYMLFREFSLTTLMGSERVVGERYGWTLDELMETFSTMPEGSTILRYDSVASDVFFNLLSSTLDQYVDWDARQCSFDSQEFRDMLLFLHTFPTHFDTTLSPEQIEEEVSWRALHGRQMLEPISIGMLCEITYRDAFFGERAAFVGYPTSDGSFGCSFILHGNKLAMSSTCQNKEAAWELIGQLIRKSGFGKRTMREIHWAQEIRLPVNRRYYDGSNRYDMTEKPEEMPPFRTTNGPIVKVDPANEDDLRRLDTLINSTTQIYWPDSELSNIVWESIGPYLAGDKSLDDTVALVQNRVSLYVNEQR